ncbi:cytochrome c family protein [Rhizobium sp. S153]|uniref:Cytochrome c family protein n=1 Tax=Ciceribacter sichuanensis TaxID=2949647 RepID=A0ABT0VIE4_9HYPH|nr:cytochrome c family protein [Ciceribacter sp. S153]MCM2404218.1 cytochrome c family protein [Ciceribacter sp. S153]
MRNFAVAFLTSIATVAGAHVAAAQTADAGPGQKLFQQRCGACHQIATARNGVGPNLQNVMGSKAGSVEGFKYSEALLNSGITWSAETLDTFLTNPGAMVRGTRMTQRFNKEDERRAIIDYLANR